MKKSSKAAPARAPKKAPKAKAEAAIPAAAPRAQGKGKKGLILGLFVVLALGVAVQGYFLWRKDQQSKMVIDFVNEIAPNGRDQDGSFCCARCLSVDQAGNLLVLEEPEVGHRLQKFSPAGKILSVYRPRAGKAEDVITNGFGVGADSKGNVYIAEASTGRIKVLSPDLKFLRHLDSGTHNSSALVVNSKDEIIITDREKSNLLVFNTKGELLRKMDGGKNRMGGPYRLALDKDDNIWVLDFGRGMGQDPDIKGYSANGDPIAKWTVKDFPANPYNYIGYHPSGYLMVNDNRGNSLARGFQFYDLKGKLLGTAQTTNNRWVIKNISGFTVDPKRGDIYINTNFIGRGGDRFTWNPLAQATE